MLVELHQGGVRPQRRSRKLAALARAAGADRASSSASTTAATTAPRCSACAGWCSRATARPTPSRSSRRSNRAYDAARNGLLDRVAEPHRRTLRRRSRRSRDARADAQRRHRAHRSIMTDRRLFPHHRHRQLPAAAPRDQRRPRGATGGATASRPPTSGSSSAPASARATSPRPTSARSDLARARRAARARSGGHATPQTIDLIIVATSTPDMVFPSHGVPSCRTSSASHGCAGVRRAGGVLAASSMRSRSPTR